MSYLQSGSALDDLKELGGWEHYAMVTRYARASAGSKPALLADSSQDKAEKLADVALHLTQWIERIKAARAAIRNSSLSLFTLNRELQQRRDLISS